jgi:predicted RNase H-like nuclease (RuvC/YqgF family)
MILFLGAVPSPLEETQSQLRDLTKELVDLRKQNDLLREQNRKIPELEEKIRVLSEGLEEEISRRATAPLSASERGLQAITHEIHHDGSIESLLNEITVLKANLVSKEALEQELRRELVSVKSCTDSQEFKCKQIIAACVGVPIENVEALLDPLFRAIESDDPVDVMDMNQMASFMNRVKEHDKDLIK